MLMSEVLIGLGESSHWLDNVKLEYMDSMYSPDSREAICEEGFVISTTEEAVCFEKISEHKVNSKCHIPAR
jgi:hypothetical protein